MAEATKNAISSEHIKQWRAVAKRLSKKVKRYNLDLDEAQRQLTRIAEDMPDPPPRIRRKSDCDVAQRTLRQLSFQRRSATQIKMRCQQARTAWGAVLDQVKSYVFSRPEVQQLKNDTIRGDAYRRVCSSLMINYAQVKGLVDQAESLLLTLAQNQRAALGMLQASGEGRFLYQQGME